MSKALRLASIMLPLFLMTGCFLHGDLVEAPPRTAKSELCKDCHPNEYREWSKSSHSKAYKSHYFRRQTDNYQVKKCLECHSAAPIYAAKELSIRHNNRSEGVNCITCHLTPDQELAGPHFVLPAHATKMKDPFYKDSKLCGTCHKEHLEEWNEVKTALSTKEQGELQTCQQCHMPKLHRKLIPEGIMQYFHWKMDTGQHTFNLDVKPPEGKSWVKITPSYRMGRKHFLVDLTMTHSIPHSLPSGIFGFKAVDLIVALKTPSGMTLEEKMITLYVEEEQNLKAGKQLSKRFSFGLEAKAKAEYIEFKVNRRNSRMDFGRTIHQEQHRI